MVTAIVTAKGQVVIPSKTRQRLKIKKGTRLCIIEKENEIILKPLTSDYFDKMAGILNTKGKLTHALLQERLRDKRSEAGK